MQLEAISQRWGFEEETFPRLCLNQRMKSLEYLWSLILVYIQRFVFLQRLKHFQAWLISTVTPFWSKWGAFCAPLLEPLAKAEEEPPLRKHGNPGKNRWVVSATSHPHKSSSIKEHPESETTLKNLRQHCKQFRALLWSTRKPSSRICLFFPGKFLSCGNP